MPKPRPVLNPPNPFESQHLEWEGPAPDVRLEVFEERAKTVVSENRSPDIGFRYSVNPYRGCFHGCTYCYARSTHEFLGFGAGTDFDRRIVVKTNVAERLTAWLRRGVRPTEPIVFSGNTDCYQPLEASYELTRRCLEACLAHRRSVGVITKGTVIRRDAALLGQLNRESSVRVTVSCAFADDTLRRHFDPFAPPVRARLETVRRLADEGVPVGVSVAPIVPGVNDSEIPEILERAREAGAVHAFMTLVRLNDSVRPYFEARLREVMPDRADKVMNTLMAMRRGRTNGHFGHRMRGEGARWSVVEQLFETHRMRLGYPPASPDGLAFDDLGPRPVARPEETRKKKPKRQLALFE
ncbi:MAG: radical SAM protein [Sandaracinaceae bacterium]